MNLNRLAPAEGVRAMVQPVIGTIAVLSVLALFVVIGLRGRGRAPSARDAVEDYVAARNSQGAGVLGLSFLASGMGAWILFAPPEVGAGIGAVGVIGYALGAAAPIVAFGLLGPRVRRIVPAGHSLTEFLRLRFGRTFHRYALGVSMAYMLLFVMAELTAVAAVAAILAGIEPRITVVAVALATLAYTAWGGLRASLRTDRWQGLLILGLVGVAVVAVGIAGTSGAGSAAATGRDLLALDGLGLEVAVTLLIAVTAANLFHQGYWQRVWAARDDQALRRGAWLGAAATVPVVLAVGGLGVLAARRGLELGAPPAPLFALLGGLPAWVALVVLTLGVALVASSVDTLENGLASLVTAERPSLPLGGVRLITVALMVPAVAVAVQGFSVLQLFLVADLLCAATVVPALSALTRRATQAGALAGAVAGLIGAVAPGAVLTGSLGGALARVVFPEAVPTLPEFAGALLASTAVTLVVSRLAPGEADLEALGARVDAAGADGRTAP